MDIKRSTGIMIFSIVNIITGLASLVIFFIPFLFGVIFGRFTDRQFFGFLDWFCLAVLDRLLFAVFYTFSFLLFWSGIAMLRMKVYSRKFAMFASSAMILSMLSLLFTSFIRSIVYQEVKFDIQFPLNTIFIVFLFYIILLIIYLTRPEIKKDFNDENVKLPLKDFALVIFILFILPLFWYLINLFVRR